MITCKDCIHYNAETKGCKRNPSVEAWEENDYCSYGVGSCGNCKWWQDEVCVNGDSEHRADFRLSEETCEKWEGE